MNWKTLLDKTVAGDYKSLARAISLIENEVPGYEDLLQLLPDTAGPKVIGITGPPGAGKSTIIDGLIRLLTVSNKRTAVICVDPSSPFNHGALLGDRIRMREWYNHPAVFIRSLATRGSLGGLSPKVIEITDVIKAAPFDYIIVETVGVGQSEIEIAGLADIAVVVLVPEAGDEIQTMKAGLMEIADIFVVNKSDRPDADSFVKNLIMMLTPASSGDIPPASSIVKTVASNAEGIDILLEKINDHLELAAKNDKKWLLLAEKALHLVQSRIITASKRKALQTAIKSEYLEPGFNLYRFVQKWTDGDTLSD